MGSFPEENAWEDWLRDMMRQYGTHVLRLCYGYLKDASLAEDAAQETFLRVWKKRHAAIRSERAWIMRIAVNVCKDMLRSAWFRHVDRHTALDEALLEAKAALDPQQRRLMEAIMRLKPRDRMVIQLHYDQDFSAEEIAQALRLSRSAVYYRLAQAQNKLRIIMEKGEAE